MRGEFVHEASARHEFPGLLVLGVKGIFHELESIVQILVHELQTVEEIGINDVEFSDQDVELLEVYGSLAVGNPLEPLHQVLLSDRCVQHVVGLGVDQELSNGHRAGLFL